MSGWQAKVEYDFIADCDLVTIWRRVGDSVYTIESTEGNGTVHAFVDDGAVRDVPKLRIPTGALQAIAAVVKPGPTQELVDLLGEALDVERRRIDDVLHALTGQKAVAS